MAEIITTNDEKASSAGQNKSVDYGKSLSWYFNDPNFGKTLLVASLWILSCLLILPLLYVLPVFMGFYVDLIRNIQNNKWEIPAFGTSEQWVTGMKYFVWSFTFGIVILILMALVMFPLVALTSEVEAMAIIMPFVMIVFIALYFLIGVISTFTPGMIFARTGSLSQMWNVNLHVAIFKKEWKNMLIGFLVMMIASYALSFIGAIACYIGILPAIVVTYLIMAGVVGQISTSEIDNLKTEENVAKVA